MRAFDDNLASPAKRRKIESAENVSSPLPIPATEVPLRAGHLGDDGATGLSDGPWRFSESFLASIEGNVSEEEEPAALPVRPWQHASIPKLKEDAKPTGRVRKNLPIPNTPDKIETPIGACRFGKSALAGFFPWTGKHPEDVLSEPNIRHGYFDRPPNPPEKEMGSAKNALFSVFKHRSGLETLSVLLGLAVERKCRIGAFSSTSNFRPPPRVTLTEAKRKAWLADLASADVPLRRLSRTIPQGIRGQSLLDQCLSNLIPISRALWFIKCVGANEIRTLKRKGPGGAVTGGSEIKWLKEWTYFVAQFLESLLQLSKDLDWKKNVQYAFGLVSQLYLENLVDRDSFLDWILKAFADADNNRTAFFFLLVQMYLPDITRFRKRSRRLACSLVEKLDLNAPASQEVLLPLVTRLNGMLRTFFLHRSVCFIMPETWSKCKKVLRNCLDLDNVSHRKLFRYVGLYNEMTAASPLEQGKDSSTPQQAIIKLLDQSKSPYHAKSIMTECNALCPDVRSLILTVMRWATSRYRAPPHQLYLAVRLLRLWERDDYDVENVLFMFIAEPTNHATDYGILKHLVAELSRSRTISISNYMQSIIVRGGAHPSSFVPSTLTLKCTTASEQSEVVPQICNDPSQILSEVSLQHLPDHARSLRKLVLARAGFHADTEGAVIHHCQWFLSKRFSLANDLLFDLKDGATFSVPPWSLLTWTVKCEISSWLRDFVQAQCKLDKDTTQPLGPRHRFRAADLSYVRDILEKMGDLAVLADILGFAANVPEENLLASVVDTIIRHAETLSAIGAFNDLQEKVCRLYLALRPSNLPMTTLATSMLVMLERYPTKTISKKLLQQDLIQGDRGSAAAACSPFSDGVAESLQQAGSHFFDDFEAILQTETNMNAQTMDKLFAVLIERIEKQNAGGNHLAELRALCQLLARLRLCRLSQSTALITAWVERQMRRGEWRTTTALLVDLVGTGCLPFHVIMTCASEVTKDKVPQKPTLSALITSLLSPQVVESDPVNYCFETERIHYITHNSMATLDILARTTSPEKLHRTIESMATSWAARIAMSKLPQLRDIPECVREYLQYEVDTILDGHDTTRKCVRIDSKDLVTLVDDLSYPLCNLSLLLQMYGAEIGAGAALGEAFFERASQTWTPDASTQQWTALLPAAGPEAAHYVRTRAEEAFFASLPPFLQSRSIMAPFESSNHVLETATKFLEITFATGDAVAGQCASSTMAQLIEKFSLAHRTLSHMNAIAVSPMATSTPIPGLGLTPAAPTPGLASPDTVAAVSQWLLLLLRMTCLQRLSSDTNLAMLTKAAQQEHIKLAIVLSTLALHPALKATDMSSRILAVVSTLITHPQFTDEMHNYCARLLKDKMRDVRVLFLFGSVNMCGSASVQDVGEGLQLHKEGTGRVGEWKQWVRNWEVIEPSGGGEGSSWVGLGMFDARRV